MKNKRLEIERALKRVNASIALDRGGDEASRYARGLAYEGYAGGYAQALRDVGLVFSGERPNTRNWWDDWTGGRK